MAKGLKELIEGADGEAKSFEMVKLSGQMALPLGKKLLTRELLANVGSR